MPKKVLFNLLFSVFLFAFLFAANVFAQTNSCTVRLDVTRVGSRTKISGATATAVNKETKRVYRSYLRRGVPYFAKLSNGQYRVTVAKAGYMKTADDIYLDCDDITTWNFGLYRGSSAKTVKEYNRIRVLKAPPLKRAEADLYTAGSTNTNRYDPLSQADPNNPKTVAGGIVNGKAANLVKPPYPAAARAVRASGAVNVQVTIDEYGNVISAQAISGHPLLRAAAVKAARESKFAPTLLEGQPVKVIGVIVYNFVP